MRTTAPSIRCTKRALTCALVFALWAGAAEEPEAPYYARIAKLASYISDGEYVGALEAFDKSAKQYEAIAEHLQALATQSEVLCQIDVVEDKEADSATADIHHLDLDWYMMLKSKADSNLVERRRQRVAVTIQRFKAKRGANSAETWRITSLSPEQILSAIAIR